MSLRSARQMASVAIACVAVTTLVTPVRAQMIVYDPSNYAQNVLQAARALQQINNQITSLQNQTQMLLNQAKNLTSLPYSSLQAIERSFVRTQQLGATSSQQLVSGVTLRVEMMEGLIDLVNIIGQVLRFMRCQRALAELTCRLPRCAEGASRCGGEPRHYAHRDRHPRLFKPVSRGRPAGTSSWQPIGCTADQTARRSHCSRCGTITGAKPCRRSHHLQSGASTRAAQPLPRW